MRIGILSDTHNHLDRTQAAVQLLVHHGAQALFHCGDLTGPDIVAAIGELPSYFVFGNNDADNVPALKKAISQIDGTCLDWGGEVTLAGKRIAVVHGHMHTDVRRLAATEPDYLLSGHSHMATDRRDGRMRRISPGALFRAAEYTVALLDLASDELVFHSVSPVLKK